MENNEILIEIEKCNDDRVKERLEAYQRFINAMERKNVTPYNVSKNSNIATSTLSDWKNGKSMPKQDKMRKIADYLDVSVDYLVLGEKPEVPNIDLTEQHIELIKLYSSLSDADQAAIMQIMRTMAK